MEPERSSTRMMFVSRLDDTAVAATVELLRPRILMKSVGTLTEAVTVTTRVPVAVVETTACPSGLPVKKDVPSHP
jgi:hypothetical protein